MTRRISRGTPAMLTLDEQKHFVHLLDQSPGLQTSIEALFNCDLSVMTYQEKVAAVHAFLEQGHSVAAIAQAAKALNDLRNLASSARGEVSLADRVRLLQTQLENANERTQAALDRNSLLSTQITSLTDELTLARAQAAGALAVHSSPQGDH